MPEIPILPNAYDGIPQLDRDRIPADEMPAFLHVTQLLANLGLYERRFLLAVYLYEYSRQAEAEISDHPTLELSVWTTGGWQSMAARDGALSIYHFGRCIEGITSSLPSCPALNSQIKRCALSNAGGIFQSSFSGNFAIRHIVAHEIDFSKTLRVMFKHAVKGPFKTGWFSSEDPVGLAWLPGNMSGHTYSVSLDGEAFSYDLNLVSAEKLHELKNQVFSAFEEATTAKPAA